jgi:hypothetical protein
MKLKNVSRAKNAGMNETQYFEKFYRKHATHK